MMLRRKMCTASEILADIKRRISEKESEIGAYITLNENAEAEAELVDNALAEGAELHPLAGIPIAVKDNISTKKIRTTCASKMLEDYIPPFDAAAVEKLRAANAVIIGKTNMDEFAMGSSTENSAFKVTRNPHNPDFIPGGSSGGSAAATACGETILALGSDTGGSVRQPASLCGVVGLKPTYGSVSRYGLIAFASSIEQIGTLARNAEDTALLYGLICGHDRRDATTVNRSYPDFAAKLRNNLSGLRIGVPPEYFGNEAEDTVKAVVMRTLHAMERNGAKLVKISLPGVKHAVAAYYVIASAEASSNLARFDGVRFGRRAKDCSNLREMYVRSRSEGFGDEVKRRIMLGTFVLSEGYYDAYYKKAKLMQLKISSEFDSAFESCDVIAAPVFPVKAIKIGGRDMSPAERCAADICTVSANLAGLPAISTPCGKDGFGVPIGIQLIGKQFGEQTLLNAVYGLEQIGGAGND